MTDPHSSGFVWRRSSMCDPGNCVEVAFAGSVVLVRDSKNQASPVLTFARSEWAAFLADVREGGFNANAPRHKTLGSEAAPLA